MNLYEFPPIAAVIDAAYGLLHWISAALDPVAGAASAALAVVLLTLVVRTALIPAVVAQARAERARRRLAPQLAELQRKHAKHPERLQQAMMDLYARENVSPLAGCLPALIQAPVVSVVYALFILQTVNGHANALLAETFFGVPLGASLAHGMATGAVTPALIAVTAGLMFVAVIVGEATRRMMRAEQAAAAARNGGGAGGRGGAGPSRSGSGGGAGATGAGSAGTPAVPGMAAIGRIATVLPFLTAVIVPFVPLAAGLYLATTVTWTLAQRFVLRRLVIERPESGGAPAGAPSPAA